MAVSKEQKKLYSEKIKPYKSKLDELKKKISASRASTRKNPRLEGYHRVHSAILGVQISNLLVMMSTLSQTIQNLKNDSLLNDARKEISNILSDLLKFVGEDMDGSLTENRDKLLQVEQFNQAQRFNLLVGIRDAIESLKGAMGPNSKWKWYFPDLQFKTAVLARNLFDFKSFEKVKDSSHPYYREWQEHLRFIITESHNAAQEFRSKYELSTREVSDLEMIRRLFEMMKRIYVFTGNREEIEKMNTSLETINEKIEILMEEKRKKKKS